MSVIKVKYGPINEVYCMLQAYLREGKVMAKYDTDLVEEFMNQLHLVLKTKPPISEAVIEEVPTE